MIKSSFSLLTSVWYNYTRDSCLNGNQFILLWRHRQRRRRQQTDCIVRILTKLMRIMDRVHSNDFPLLNLFLIQWIEMLRWGAKVLHNVLTAIVSNIARGKWMMQGDESFPPSFWWKIVVRDNWIRDRYFMKFRLRKLSKVSRSFQRQFNSSLKVNKTLFMLKKSQAWIKRIKFDFLIEHRKKIVVLLSQPYWIWSIWQNYWTKESELEWLIIIFCVNQQVKYVSNKNKNLQRWKSDCRSLK